MPLIKTGNGFNTIPLAALAQLSGPPFFKLIMDLALFRLPKSSGISVAGPIESCEN